MPTMDEEIEMETEMESPPPMTMRSKKTKQASQDRRPEAKDALDLRAWLESFGDQEIIVKVYRRSPTSYRGVSVEGHVGTYHEFISEEKVGEDHGGGIFQVVVHQRQPNGRAQIAASRQLKIAGEPKLPQGAMTEALASPATPVNEDPGLASLAMNTMLHLTKEARQDAKQASSHQAFDPSMMRLMNEPIMEQLRTQREMNLELQRQNAEKDARLVEALHRKPDTTLQDDLLKSMWGSESGRIEGLRAQHDSEMRQMKAFHTEEIARIREQARDDMKERSRGHERELEALKDSTRAQIDSIKISYEARIDGLKSESNRLNAELAQLKGEIGELRSRKDKSLTDQAEEIVKVQEAFKALGVGGSKDEDDDSDKPVWERALSRVMENPGAIGELIGGVRQNVQPGAPQQQQVQLPPPGVPFQGPDGKVYAMTPDGRAARLPPGGVSPAVRKKAIAAKAAKEAEKAGLPRPPDAGEMALAIQFMESAAGNGTDPATFAAGARAAIPSDVLLYVEKVGIDEVLNQANLDANSPLRSLQGRNFARNVAKILLSGTTG